MGESFLCGPQKSTRCPRLQSSATNSKDGRSCERDFLSDLTDYSWTIRGSNPGGSEIFRTRTDRPPTPPSLLYNIYRVSCPVIKRPGRGVDSPPNLALRLKKVYSYTTPPLSFVACSGMNFTTTFYLAVCNFYSYSAKEMS